MTRIDDINRLLTEASPNGQTKVVSPLIINNSYVSVDPSEVKVGNTLERVDLFSDWRERMEIIQTLRNEYGLSLLDTMEAVDSISFTSRKGIVRDTEGKKYFLKQKPKYSDSPEQLQKSAMMQITLAKHLRLIPPLILTNSGEPYVRMGSKIFTLTPFIEGRIYMGQVEQSFSCAATLGEIHRTAAQVLPPMDDILNSTEETMNFIGIVEQTDFPDYSLKEEVMERMPEINRKYATTSIGRIGWLHGDFAPFNMIFDKNTSNQVVGVTDYDNVAYGPVARDLGECLLTHCDINYAAATSFLSAPIRTKIDINRMQRMFAAYQQTNPLPINELHDMPKQMVQVWLELMCLGLVRGDYSLKDVHIALLHGEEIYLAAKSIINDNEGKYL